jgi:hypothetical protein
MKCTRIFSAALAAACLFLSSSAMAAVIVNDTWIDNDRNDPASPVFAENGVDGDADGDIESAWFGTSGTLSTSPGTLHLGTTGGTTSSQSWATYFAREAYPVTLANEGDQLNLTWVFSLSGAPTALNSSQNMRVALVNTPSAARLTTDTNPGNASYTGYAVFLNMGPTLDRGNPMELKPRLLAVNPSNLLSSSGNWSDVDADGGTDGATGYAEGVDYTFAMTVTRVGADLQVDTSMSGGNLNDTGSMSASYLHVAPSSYSFDTFTMRPTNTATTAELFNTSLFRVEGPLPIPEPTSLALVGLSALALMVRRQR